MKRRGNELLAAGKPAEAAEAYSLAIKADPSVAALWSNRSAALLKAGDAAGALRDAEEAARLEPAWPKGQLRRAKALEALGRFSDAIEACGLGETAAIAAGAPESEAREFRRLRGALAMAEARSSVPASSPAGRAAEGGAAASGLSAQAVRGAAVAKFFDGVVSVETGQGWARPWRLAHGDRGIYDESLAAQAACAAVRLVVRTAGRVLRVAASVAAPEGVDEATLERNGGYPMEYELYVNGEFFGVRQIGATKGASVISFDKLPEGKKDLELWLPPAVALDVHAVDTGDAIERPLSDSRPVWICYGSSICHGGPTQASPSGTWPCLCSRLANVRVVNLGFGGQCFLDQGVARAIRDMPCDCISLKVGINIQCLGAFTARTFPSAVMGFVQTVRDGHPTTPLVLVSPIFHGALEDKAPVKKPEFMSLMQFREKLQETVETLRSFGDEHVFYRDGLELLGGKEQALLYDGLHPGAEGHRLMGRRFAQLEFGPKGRLLAGRLPEGAVKDLVEETSATVRKDVLGPFVCEVPGGQRCRMVVAEVPGGLACKSDRPDWPASPVHVRGDLLFLRSTPGVWGRIEGEGQAVTFSNGIKWVRAPGAARPAGRPA